MLKREEEEDLLRNNLKVKKETMDKPFKRNY